MNLDLLRILTPVVTRIVHEVEKNKDFSHHHCYKCFSIHSVVELYENFVLTLICCNVMFHS